MTDYHDPARRTFETLQMQVNHLAQEGEDGQDQAWQLRQDILWWVLDAGARDDGPNEAYLVALDRCVKDGRAERTLLALSMVRGVVGVTPVPADIAVDIAESRIRSELIEVAMDRATKR